MDRLQDPDDRLSWSMDTFEAEFARVERAHSYRVEVVFEVAPSCAMCWAPLMAPGTWSVDDLVIFTAAHEMLCPEFKWEVA